MRVSRDSSFVRVDLPPPGRWVIAMCPNTAMYMAHIIGERKPGSHKVDGSVKVTMHAIDETYVRFTFPPWPGEVYWSDSDAARFCRQIRLASESHHDVGIPSSGAEVQVGV